MMVSNKLPGGRGDRITRDSFDPKVLAEGTAHEMEHTDDRAIAEEIAIDHLVEDPRYYEKLKRIEKALADAPAYRPSDVGEVNCRQCTYARGGFCGLYQFFAEGGYTCDSAASRGLTDASIIDHDPVALEMGPPPMINRPRHPYVGTLVVQGVLVNVENEPGSLRSGVDQNGDPWETNMLVHYGEIVGTTGADNEPIDCYVGGYPSAPYAYVIHQKDMETSAYDEDKVMLGFLTADDAVETWAAHWDREVPAPGVSVIPMADMISMLADGQGDLQTLVKCACQDAAKAEQAVGNKIKSAMRSGYTQRQAVATATEMRDRGELKQSYLGEEIDEDDEEIEKAGLARRSGSKPPQGYIPVPKSKAGGWYKIVAGERQYWYPKQQHPGVAEWEADEAPVTSIKPGDLVMVTDKRGMFRWVPDAGERAATKPGKTLTLQNIDSLAVVTVDRGKVKTVKQSAKLPPPPPAGPRPEVKLTPPTRGAPAIKIGREKGSASKFRPVKGSSAKAGTATHDLESGKYPVAKITSADSDRTSYGVVVPESERVRLAAEWGPLMKRAAREVASRRPGVPYFRGGQVNPDFEDILAGAKLGFVMALRSYVGGRPFAVTVGGYMRQYAAAAKREAIGGVQLTRSEFKMLAGYSAAEAEATAKTGGTPTVKQIAERWRVSKRQALNDRDLGRYQLDGRTVDQNAEPVPLDEEWQLRGPTGELRGKTYPSRIALAERMMEITTTGKADLQIVLDHAEASTGFYGDMPAGMIEHVKGEVESVVARMKEPQRSVLLAGAGLIDPSEMGSKDQTAMLWDRQSIPEPKEVAEALGIPLHRWGKMFEDAVDQFKQVASASGANIDVEGDSRTLFGVAAQRERPPAVGPVHSTWFPATNELISRYGNQERAQIAQAAIENGEFTTVDAALNREMKGTASNKAVADLRRKYAGWVDKRRQEAFDRVKMTPVDPESARASGPQGAGSFDTLLGKIKGVVR